MVRKMLGLIALVVILAVGALIFLGSEPEVGIVVEALADRRVAKLVTREVSYTAHVDLRGHKAALECLNGFAKAKDILLGAREFEATVPVRMLLGVDLGELGPENVAVLSDGGYRITLPSVRILEYTIDVASPACEVRCSASTLRHLWDRLMREPDYGETVVDGLRRLEDRDFITDNILSRLDLDGRSLAGTLPQVMAAVLESKGIRAEIVVPETDARSMVKEAL